MAYPGESDFVVPELRREREASQLDLPELTAYLDGGEMIGDMRRKICKLEEGESGWGRINYLSPVLCR